MKLSLAVLLCSLTMSAATAFRCGRLLDVKSGTLRDDVIIIVENGKITTVGGPAPAGVTTVDLSKGTCMPGLMDMHDHLTSDPTDSGYQSLGVSVPRQTVKGVKNARITLQAGFTTVRNVGASGYSDVALKEGIEAGEVEGPRLFVSGPALGITGGHCDENLLAPEFHFKAEAVADGPWAARARVRENIKYGVDLIKICASGGVLSKGDSPGAPQYTLEEMVAIADEAHKLGRKVAAHAHGTQSIKDAIRAGIDSIEHASLIDDEGIKMAKEKGTFLVFDIYNDDYILTEGAKVGMLPESIEKERAIGKLQRQNFRHAYLGGARMAFGTDGGVYPHGDNWKQFPIMVEYGMKPIEAIRSATVDAAELVGVAGKAGSLEKGYWADLIAIEGNPLTDIRAMEKVRFVMKEGKVYRNDWAAKK